MNLALYQVVIVILAIAMIFQGIQKYRSQISGQTLLKLGVRILVWGGMAVVVAFPRVTNLVADIIGIENNINAVILGGFLLLFLIVFKLLSAIERLEQQLTVLVRNTSLKKEEELSEEK